MEPVFVDCGGRSSAGDVVSLESVVWFCHSNAHVTPQWFEICCCPFKGNFLLYKKHQRAHSSDANVLMCG
jgi:hypothetical protein